MCDQPSYCFYQHTPSLIGDTLLGHLLQEIEAVPWPNSVVQHENHCIPDPFYDIDALLTEPMLITSEHDSNLDEQKDSLDALNPLDSLNALDDALGDALDAREVSENGVKDCGALMPHPPLALSPGGNTQQVTAPGSDDTDDDDLRREIYRRFTKPVKDAAKEMKMSLSSFKKTCLRLGIGRWPYRKLWSLKHTANHLTTSCTHKMKYVSSYCSLLYMAYS